MRRLSVVRALSGALAVLAAASVLSALTADVLHSVRAVPPHIAGRFRDPRGFQQSAFGQYFVFDRRGHTVYGIDEAQTDVWQIVHIGGEEGRILRPTAFSVAPNGSFAVADAPGGRERIQIFTPVGFRIGGFTLPQRTRPRVTFDTAVLSGVGSVSYTGSSILISQPESGSLVVEYNLRGEIVRTFGELRSTGHEADRDVHLALNSGFPLPDPGGGFYYVFQAGVPVFRKLDADGRLVFERLVQGREIDPLISALPTVWRPRIEEQPMVMPTVRAAAVDPGGRLWLSFVEPFTYVYDRDGDKVRTLQFRGAGLVAPASLAFGPSGRLLVTPGLYEFAADGSVR
jgi:hypothetical protein